MFDPTEMTVKEAIPALEGLSQEDLLGVRMAEMAGKDRVSLIREIDEHLEALIDDLVEIVAEDLIDPEPVKVVEVVPTISVKDWFRLPKSHRKMWIRDGRTFRKR